MKQGRRRKVHFASLMDLCHLKQSEWEPQYQKVSRQSRSDTVKDDSGSYAVFTEQGSSASKMTAAKVMDIISRLPGCAGQAADAASACTQVKLEDAPTLVKILKSECPDIWIRLPKHKWPKSWSRMEDPVVPLERNLYGHPFGRTIRGTAIWESSIEITVGKKVQVGNVSSFTENKGCSYLCMWPISNWLGKSRTLARLGKFWWKTLIWENQHHFLTMLIGVAYTENVRLARILWIITEVCSNQGFLPGLQKLQNKKATEKPHAETVSSWSYDMEGHAEKCAERYCELATKTTEQWNKVATPCIDDHQFKE